MKRIILNILLVSLLIPIGVYAKNTGDAKELIDTDKLTNLILNYNYDDYEFNDVEVKIYYVASISNNFQYKLENEFKDYSINPNGIRTNENWDVLKSTLESYIKADNIKETEKYYIKDNKVEIENLKAGLYLVQTNKIDTENYTLLFDSFLINLPDLNERYWNYDVIVYPKANTFTSKYEIVEYTVLKQWQDNKENRPYKIDIEIYKDGGIVYNEILSSDNNWTFKWKTEDDGSVWTAVERNVPSGYNVYILNKDKEFIIINTDDTEEKNPQTLDNINLYFYLLIGSFIGLVLLITILIKIKKKA